MKKLMAVTAIIAILLTFVSCGTIGKDNKDKITLTGVYTKNAVKLKDDFTNYDNISMYDNRLYLIGSLPEDGDGRKTVAVIDPDSLKTEYTSLPINAYVNTIAADGDDWLISASSFDQTTSQTEHYICHAKNGEIIWKNGARNYLALPEFYFDSVHTAMGGGRWYVGADREAAEISSDGKLLRTYALPGRIQGMACDTEGVLHVWGWDYHHTLKGSAMSEEGWKKAVNKDVCFGDGFSCYILDETGLNGYDAAGGTSTILVNWVNSSIMRSHIRSMAVVSPELIFIYGYDIIDGETQLWKYVKSKDRVLSGDQIIRITYMENGRHRIPLAAVKFNTMQKDYYVVCDEYSSAYADSGYSVVFDYIDKRIVDGDIGDIIVSVNAEDVAKYADKNLLCDLYTLMGDDFPADDIFGCIRRLCETDGKLYSLPQDFKLTTYTMKSSLLSDIDVWNVKAFIELDDKFDGQLLLSMTREEVYYTLRDSVICECIDFTKGSCDFESELFVSFLEYLSSLPENDPTERNYSDNYYANDEVALYRAFIGSYSQYAQMMYVFGEGEEVSAVGYPSADGGVIRINDYNNCFSITNDSDAKDGAMKFLRYFLSADCVIDEMRGMCDIPALKSTMQKWNESESKLYYYFYADNVSRISCRTSPVTDKREPVIEVTIDQKLIDEVYAYLDSAKILDPIPQAVIDIVEEEMTMYLASAKTAEETAKVIQNRVSIYLNERG